MSLTKYFNCINPLCPNIALGLPCVEFEVTIDTPRNCSNCGCFKQQHQGTMLNTITGAYAPFPSATSIITMNHSSSRIPSFNPLPIIPRAGNIL